ncbi:MAG: hypothetical protein IJW73_02795 [Candidatus Gastranaerophilales bacterium]|nr:hypothetical protein [Candidatus Gastranaerophilales bacterium]
MKELTKFDFSDIKPTELGGNGLSGNGLSGNGLSADLSQTDFDAYLKELEF